MHSKLFPVFLALSSFSSVAQDLPATSEAPELQSVFLDDFAEDTRSDYVVSGTALWKNGSLALQQGGAIERHIEASPWVEVRLELGARPEEHSRSELRLLVVLSESRSCGVRLKSDLSDEGSVCSLAVIDLSEMNGEVSERIVREAEVSRASPQSLSVEYRNGVVVARLGRDHSIAGFIGAEPPPAQAITIEARVGHTEVTRISAKSQRVRDPDYSPDVLRQLAKADADNEQLVRLYGEGKIADAVRFGEQALSTRKSVLGLSHHDTAESLYNLAVMYQRMRDIDRALPLYVQAVPAMRATFGELHPDYAASLISLGMVYKERAEYARSEELYLQAASIRKTVFGEQHVRYAAIVNNLGDLYRSLGDFRRAKPLLHKAVEINRALGVEEPIAVNNLAVLYDAMGDHSTAIPLYRSAVEMQEKAVGKQHYRYAEALSNLAGGYERMGKPHEAEPLFLQALEIQKSVLGEQHPRYAVTLNNLGMMHFRNREFSRGEPFCRKARDIWRATLGERHPYYAICLHNLAALYEAQEQHARAEPLYRQALKIQESLYGEQHREYALSLNKQATLYHKMKRPEAGRLFKRALQIQRRQLALAAPVQSERQQKRHQVQSSLFMDSRLTNGLAAHASSSTVDLLEEVWEWKGAVTGRQRAYRQVAANPELAPLFTRLRKISAQLSGLSTRAPPPPGPAADESQEAEYRAKRSHWQTDLADLTAEFESVEQDIASRSIDYRRIHEPLTVDAVQSWLPESTAFIDFYEYEHGLTTSGSAEERTARRRFGVFIVRRDRPPVFLALASARGTADAIESLRLWLSSPDEAAPAEATLFLREQLWLPIEEHLGGINTVIISPDTVLGTLPFAALPASEAGRYLVEKYRIVTVPTAAQLRELVDGEGQRSVDGGLVLVGDVDYDSRAASTSGRPPRASTPKVDSPGPRSELRGGRQVFITLPGFRQELEVVRDAFRSGFPNEPATVLRGGAATETEFLHLASRARIVHVITHGYFEAPGVKAIGQSAAGQPSAPAGDAFIETYLPSLLSGLAMAGANDPSDDDGILRALEIEAASLQGVDLVMLSACETGLGAVAGGEGLTGLQRAFQVAGARSVIASLWKVDDRATLELVRQFYTNRWIKRQSKVDALRNAQLQLLNSSVLPDGSTLRGEPVRRRSTPAGAKPPETKRRTHPMYWAAWTLSGDWR